MFRLPTGLQDLRCRFRVLVYDVLISLWSLAVQARGVYPSVRGEAVGETRDRPSPEKAARRAWKSRPPRRTLLVNRGVEGRLVETRHVLGNLRLQMSRVVLPTG